VTKGGISPRHRARQAPRRSANIKSHNNLNLPFCK
jgi:hypothetical protein